MAGKGGGAWKVAYADFVTAMMAFFMVMWIVAQSKPVKKAVAQYFKDPWKTSTKPTGESAGGSPLLPTKTPSEAPGPLPIPGGKRGNATGLERGKTNPKGRGRSAAAVEGKSAPAEKKTPVQADRPSLFAIHDGDERCVGTLVLFAENSAELDEASKERLRRLAPEVRGKPFKIEIRGHATRCPASPGGPPQDAWRLSYARCVATMKFLEQQGIEADRIRLSQGGPYEPYSIHADAAKLAYNSRVEVYMLSEFAADLMGTPEERASRFLGP
jgi:chemotaxis protein MotB